MEAAIAETAIGQFLGIRRLARAAERARGAKPGIVNQDDEDVGGAFRRAKLLNGRKMRVRVLGIVGDEPSVSLLGDRKDVTRQVVGRFGHGKLLHGTVLDSMLRRPNCSSLSGDSLTTRDKRAGPKR
jgi:hypothetical protein